MAITFFNQWRKLQEFSFIIIEYKQVYDQVDESHENIVILGCMGFGVVLVLSIKHINT